MRRVPDEFAIYGQRRLPVGRLLVVFALTYGRARLAITDRGSDVTYEKVW